MPLAVQQKFDSYPNHIKKPLLEVRSLILDIIDANNLGQVEENLKWGQPSYMVKGGSAVRLGWQQKTPDKYLIFFNCNTKLVDTFRQLYPNELDFQGNRAIVLSINDPLPSTILRHCIELALQYKNLRHLPLLGA